LMMNPVPWLQMTNMISYQGLVRTFPREAGRFMLHEPNLYLSRSKNSVCPDPVIQLSPSALQ
ncbi:hypothetical protein ACV1D8_21830, partial [Aeromonas caviae]